MDRDDDADQRHGDEDPAQGVEIRHERQDCGLGLGQDALRNLDAGRTQLALRERVEISGGKGSSLR